MPLSAKTNPILAYKRHITGYIADTTSLEEVTIFRNGKPMHTFSTKETTSEFTIDESDPIKDIALTSSDERPDFVYYYLRARQKNDHVA